MGSKCNIHVLFYLISWITLVEHLVVCALEKHIYLWLIVSTAVDLSTVALNNLTFWVRNMHINHVNAWYVWIANHPLWNIISFGLCANNRKWSAYCANQGFLHLHGPLTRYIKLRIPLALRTFSPPQRVSDPSMHHGTCLAAVWQEAYGLLVRWRSRTFGGSWRGSLLVVSLKSVAGKTFQRMHNPQFYVSVKRTI